MRVVASLEAAALIPDDAVSVLLVGSRALGCHHERSDLDVVVVTAASWPGPVTGRQKVALANDYEMVRTACAGGSPVPFTVDSAVRFIARVERRPSHAPVEYLLRLVNLALLDRLAGGNSLGRFDAGAPLPSDVEIVSYDQMSAGQRHSLLSERELDPDAVHYSLDEECEAVTPIGDAGLLYIARNGEFDIVIDEDVNAWARLLPALGTAQTRKSLADLSGLDEDVVHRLLGDGLGAGFVFSGTLGEDR